MEERSENDELEEPVKPWPDDSDDMIGHVDQLGCLWPDRCVMQGMHMHSECHTAEDMLNLEIDRLNAEIFQLKQEIKELKKC